MKKLLVLLLFFTQSLSAAKLHVLVVVDTDRAVGTFEDMQKMTDLSKQISRYTGLNLNLRILRGPSFTKKHLKYALDYLHVESDDVVLFYYAGHGFRTSTTKSPWPIFHLGFGASHVSMADVIQDLEELKPRLCVVIGDSCNNIVDGYKSLNPTPKTRTEILPHLFAEGYEKLFLHYQGTIIASGSLPGDYAVGFPDGGLFTSVLLNSLEQEIHAGDPDWDIILQRACLQAIEEAQYPQYEIRIKPLIAP